MAPINFKFLVKLEDAGEMEAIKFCRNNGLIAEFYTCPKCGEKLRLSTRKDIGDGCEWRCSLGNHDTKRSIRKGSFFKGAHMNLSIILQIIIKMALNLPLDEKLAANLNRRRIAEELRKKRIFDAKQRQIGVDTDALNYQVHEKILCKEKEADQDRKFAEELKRQAYLAELLEEEKEEQIQELNKKIDSFRLSEQRPEYRRDYDLYDPNRFKKERPPRIADNEFCPVSNLQKFEGEDLSHKERCKKQKEQMRDMLFQQMQEKRIHKYKMNKEVHDWETLMLQQDMNATEIAFLEHNKNKKVAKDLGESNKKMSIEAKEREIQQKIQDEIENRKDIQNNFYGDLLSENPDVARSAFGPHRVVPDRWKGMSKKQLEEYYRGQVQQMFDKKKKDEQDQYETAKWDEQIMCQDKTALLLDEDEKKQKSELNKSVAYRNYELALQQKQQQDYINRVIYTNIPSEEYFNQFNTSSR